MGIDVSNFLRCFSSLVDSFYNSYRETIEGAIAHLRSVDLHTRGEELPNYESYIMVLSTLMEQEDQTIKSIFGGISRRLGTRPRGDLGEFVRDKLSELYERIVEILGKDPLEAIAEGDDKIIKAIIGLLILSSYLMENEEVGEADLMNIIMSIAGGC